MDVNTQSMRKTKKGLSVWFLLNWRDYLILKCDIKKIFWHINLIKIQNLKFIRMRNRWKLKTKIFNKLLHSSPFGENFLLVWKLKFQISQLCCLCWIILINIRRILGLIINFRFTFRVSDKPLINEVK